MPTSSTLAMRRSHRARGGIALTISNIVVAFLLHLVGKSCGTCSAHMFPVPHIALLCLSTCHAVRSARALSAEALASHAQEAASSARAGLLPAVPSTRRPCPHGRILTLEALPSPRFCEGEGFELLLVLLLRDCAVFWTRHWLAGLIDIAGPSLAVGGLSGGFGEGGIAVCLVGAGTEECFGLFTDRHGYRRLWFADKAVAGRDVRMWWESLLGPGW